MKRTLSIIACICCLGIAFATLAACTKSTESSSASIESSSVEVESDSSSQQFSQVSDSSISSAGNEQLLKDIKSIVKKSGMQMGVCAIDLRSGAHVDVNGDTRMVAASMIKLIVAASFLQYVEDGKASLKDSYTLKESDIVGGTGSIGGLGEGAEVTYGKLLEKMISESDNTAANILIDEMGMGLVNRTARELGLSSTKLNRLMMDEQAIEEGVENYVSANDVAMILELAYSGQLVSAKASKTLISALEKQTEKDGILQGLPRTVKLAHKTGSLTNAQHDGGIVEDPNGHDFILVVLCGGKGYSQDSALEAMKKIGKAAYDDIVGAKAA